jgi:hypothetical protein
MTHVANVLSKLLVNGCTHGSLSCTNPAEMALLIWMNFPLLKIKWHMRITNSLSSASAIILNAWRSFVLMIGGNLVGHYEVRSATSTDQAHREATAKFASVSDRSKAAVAFC